MTDYAASPIQPIATALVATPIAGMIQNFTKNHGFLSVIRTPGGAPAGDFTLTVDPGLPGDVAFDPTSAHTRVELRGNAVTGLVAAGTMPIAVTYGPEAFPHAGSTTIRVVFGVVALPIDPNDWEVTLYKLKPGASIPQGGGPTPPPPPPPLGPGVVPLGGAANFTILAKTGIANIPTSSVQGNIGVSPAAASFITGFSPLALDGSGTFATNAQISGRAYAADYAPPTPAFLTAAVLDMQGAYTAANAFLPDQTNFNGGALGGQNLPPGTYAFNVVVSIAGGDLTLTGGPNDTWVFQLTQGMNVQAARSIVLAGGAQAQNVVFAVAGVAAFGVGSHGEGVFLAGPVGEITLDATASLHGRALSQTQVTLNSDTLTLP